MSYVAPSSERARSRDGDRHPVVVGAWREVLGPVPDPGAPGGRGVHQDRLHEVLRHVADARRAREHVGGVAARVGAPGADAAELLAGDRSAERRGADEVLRRGLRDHGVGDAEVVEDLHRALVRDVRTGLGGQRVVPGDDEVVDAEIRQREGHRGAGRAAADHDDVGGRGGWTLLRHGGLPLGSAATGPAHPHPRRAPGEEGH